MKKRVHFWDNYKGILIALVVFGHFIYSYAQKIPNSFAHDIYIFIYTFHMPAFIFCSGYFSKSEHSRSPGSLTALLLYYLFFNTLMGFFAYFYLGSSIKILTPYYSYWYILSLLAWRVLIDKIQHVKGIVFLSVLIALLIGFSNELGNLLSLRRTVAFFPFFIAGYLLDTDKVQNFLSRRKPWHMVVYAFIVLIATIAAFWASNHFAITSNATLMSAYSKNASAFHRLLIFAISATMIGCLFLVVPNRHIPLLSTIGKNSLLIYLAHRFFTLLYYQELFPYKTYRSVYLVYAIVATLLLCIILGNESLNRITVKFFGKMADTLSPSNSKNAVRTVTAFIYILICLLLLHSAPDLKDQFAKSFASEKQISSATEATQPAERAPKETAPADPAEP